MTKRIAGGALTTDIQLASSADRMARWEPDDCRGDVRNADPRIITRRAATADEAEAQVMAILSERGCV